MPLSHALTIAPYTSRAPERRLIFSDDNSRITQTPDVVNNNDRPPQHVTSLQQRSSLGKSVEFVTQPQIRYLRGFHSGTLTITPSRSILFSSTRNRCANEGPLPSAFSKPSVQTVQAAHGSDSDSDTPLLQVSVISKAKHTPVRRNTDSEREHSIRSSAGNSRIHTVVQSRHTSESSSGSSAPSAQKSVIESVRILQDSHDRTRRILIPSSGSALFNITSHGFIDMFDLSPLRFILIHCRLLNEG